MLKIKVDRLFFKLKRLDGVFAHCQAELAPAVNNKSNRGAWQIQHLFCAVGGSFNYPKYAMWLSITVCKKGRR